MTDKTDVVERLRDVPNFNDGRVAHEAADELTRLRAEVARLEAEKQCLATALKLSDRDAKAARRLQNCFEIIEKAIDTAMRGDREDG